jgi:hypothetical protein
MCIVNAQFLEELERVNKSIRYEILSTPTRISPELFKKVVYITCDF